MSCECPSGFTGPLCEEEVAACGGAFRNAVGRIDFPPEEGATYGHQLSCDFLISVEEGKVLMTRKLFNILVLKSLELYNS